MPDQLTIAVGYLIAFVCPVLVGLATHHSDRRSVAFSSALTCEPKRPRASLSAPVCKPQRPNATRTMS
jgi:hypothetical protein